MSRFKRFLAGTLAIAVVAGFGLIAGATLSRIYDRVTGGVISADNDDTEFDNIYTELSAHVAALNPHTNALDVTGDTMTGNLIMDGADVHIWDGNDLKMYSDGGITEKFSVDGATGTVTAAIGNIADGHMYGQPLMFSKTIILPEYVKAQIAHIPILPVEAGWAPFGITVTNCGIKLDANRAYSVNFEEFTDPITADAAIATVATGAGEKEKESGAITKDIEAGNIVVVELPATTGALFLQVWVIYELNAS